MLRYIYDDIISNIDPNVQTVIAHGCNCIHVMNAGIAKYLRELYPGIFEADLKTIRADRYKLGTYSIYQHTENLIFLNCYTQFGIFNFRNKSPFELEALNQCLIKIAQNYHNWQIRLPRIGAHHGHGDWNVIKKCIQQIADEYNLDITIYIK